MKSIHITFILLLLVNISIASAPIDSTYRAKNSSSERILTIEPAVGLNPMPLSDVLFSNLVQWNFKKHLNLVSRSSVTFNTAFARTFNNIHTDYSRTYSQTIGMGTTVYSKHSSYTFSLMAGIKYDETKETLNNPEFEKVSFAVHTLSPDFGLMYSYKRGFKSMFFTYRMYIPLYPYPFKTADINAVDGNVAGISFEFGVGFTLK